VFVACDWTGAELVALAQTCWSLFGHSEMRDAINDGKDLHLAFGAKLLGISYEEAVQRKKDPDVKNARQLAKIANFGFPGGLGPDALLQFARAYGVTMDLSRAKHLKAEWLETWPEMVSYFRNVAEIVSDFGPRAVTQLGSGRVRGGLGYCQAANTFFQGLVADAAKDALWEVAKASYMDKGSPLYGFRPIFFVHDEIIGEAPEAQAHEMAMELQRVMVAVLAKWCPDMKTAATAHLMRRWSKAAEETYDESGRLIPWEEQER
jgi:DNA polymerase-1